jgi:hypothetical protein
VVSLGRAESAAGDGAGGVDDPGALGGRAALVHVPHLNRVLEGINSLIQAAKARARGCRNVDNPITMAYLIAGQLRFNVSVFR